MKLKKRDVLYIFSQRAQVNTHDSNAVTSRQMAATYGISERTVRDIWSRRSRRNLTKSAWTVEETLSDNKAKRIGRPPGAKDTSPRQRSQTSGSEEDTSSDGSATRQSDTTGSGNRDEGSGHSYNSQQEHSSASGSLRGNSCLQSGESSPHQSYPLLAPAANKQHLQNDQLNQTVLMLLNHDWQTSSAQRSATDPMQNQPSEFSMRAPTQHQLISTSQTVAPNREAFQSTQRFAHHFAAPHAFRQALPVQSAQQGSGLSAEGAAHRSPAASVASSSCGSHTGSHQHQHQSTRRPPLPAALSSLQRQCPPPPAAASSFASPFAAPFFSFGSSLAPQAASPGCQWLGGGGGGGSSLQGALAPPPPLAPAGPLDPSALGGHASSWLQARAAPPLQRWLPVATLEGAQAQAQAGCSSSRAPSSSSSSSS
eukprot:CAMPEP_0177712592 /NCGR_PEP_ID=MMETSP0484_2-20121128/12485_1 /TAXON_ID=354590 /ORGANISM="Rhodomonas lens, Strain RHODO" /LENGTH=424 /DNA_ID=CAMNT_0019224419 /DNA_START=110 /DNA_END=1380 /DNA_ORIENTATION=+